MFRGKKKYLVPVIDVIELDAFDMLAASPKIDATAADIEAAEGEQVGNDIDLDDFESSKFSAFEFELDDPFE